MTHQQIAAPRGLEPIDMVTICRSLATIKGSGLLHVVRGADGTAMFCANGAGSGCPGGHPHFQCLECGEMSCVRNQRPPRLSLAEATVVKAKQWVAFGLCAASAKTAASRAVRRRRQRREAAE
jgi:Fe2+ or Zn2+ uptake regulation protein